MIAFSLIATLIIAAAITAMLSRNLIHSALLLVGNEVSGTTTVYAITPR